MNICVDRLVVISVELDYEYLNYYILCLSDYSNLSSFFLRLPCSYQLSLFIERNLKPYIFILTDNSNLTLRRRVGMMDFVVGLSLIPWKPIWLLLYKVLEGGWVEELKLY